MNNFSARSWQDLAETLGVSRLLLHRPPGLLLAAHRLTLARHFPQAEQAYLELLKIEPKHRAALLNLANLLLIQGRQPDAAHFRGRIIENDVEALNLAPEDHATTLRERLTAALILPRSEQKRTQPDDVEAP